MRLMHHLVEHGSDGLVVCVPTGEAATLNDEEHLAVIELAGPGDEGPGHGVAGMVSNDTRHAVFLTERQPNFAPTRCCRSIRSTTAPRGARIFRHSRG